MKLYTTTTCAPCKMLKQTIADEGLDAGLEIEQDPDKFPPEVRAVPTLETEGGSFITGLQYILPYLRFQKEMTQ